MAGTSLKARIQINILVGIAKFFFNIQKRLMDVRIVNYPKGQAIWSIWHGEQCLCNYVQDKDNFYVLISTSNDGEFIARAVESLNIKSIRGSSKRKAVSGSLQIIDKLKKGASIGLTVDGPRGPIYKVKEGIVNISKLSGVPIIPVVWTSKDKTMHKFNSWDKFQFPIGFCKAIVMFGEPIYVPNELTKEESKNWCLKIEEEMNKIKTDLEENYDKYWQEGIKAKES